MPTSPVTPTTESHQVHTQENGVDRELEEGEMGSSCFMGTEFPSDPGHRADGYTVM